MGKLVTKGLHWYCTTNDILDPNQNGFRPNRSTVDNVLELQQTILDRFNRHEETCCVFSDIRKASDSVQHSDIIHSSIEIGIKGHLLTFVKAFLKMHKIENHDVQFSSHLGFGLKMTIG